MNRQAILLLRHRTSGMISIIEPESDADTERVKERRRQDGLDKGSNKNGAGNGGNAGFMVASGSAVPDLGR